MNSHDLVGAGEQGRRHVEGDVEERGTRLKHPNAGGKGASREHAVVGDTPNLAARLQALAEPGTVVVAASTRRLLGDLFRLRELGLQRVKGINEPIAAWTVDGVSAFDEGTTPQSFADKLQASVDEQIATPLE